MEAYLIISHLNDFLFCPRSIYFHNLYANYSQKNFHREVQTMGNIAHKSIDNKQYSTKKNDIISLDVYSQKYNLVGKIDVLHKDQKLLVERKRKIKFIYDGYKFQLYAQYFCLIEMGYKVNKLALHSLVDNKRFFIDLPNNEEIKKFEQLIDQIKSFNLEQEFYAIESKCKQCIYSNLCDKSLAE